MLNVFRHQNKAKLNFQSAGTALTWRASPIRTGCVFAARHTRTLHPHVSSVERISRRTAPCRPRRRLCCAFACLVFALSDCTHLRCDVMCVFLCCVCVCAVQGWRLVLRLDVCLWCVQQWPKLRGEHARCTPRKTSVPYRYNQIGDPMITACVYVLRVCCLLCAACSCWCAVFHLREGTRCRGRIGAPGSPGTCTGTI